MFNFVERSTIVERVEFNLVASVYRALSPHHSAGPDSTQLNSTGSWDELSLKSDHIVSGDVITLRTQLNWDRPVFCQSRQSEQVLNFYNQLSWVESDQAVWSREKLVLTQFSVVSQ